MGRSLGSVVEPWYLDLLPELSSFRIRDLSSFSSSQTVDAAAVDASDSNPSACDQPDFLVEVVCSAPVDFGLLIASNASGVEYASSEARRAGRSGDGVL